MNYQDDNSRIFVVGEKVVTGGFNKYGKRQLIRFKEGTINKIINSDFRNYNTRIEVRCSESNGVYTVNADECYNSLDDLLNNLEKENKPSNDIQDKVRKLEEELKWAKINLAKEYEKINLRKELIENLKK